MELKTKSEKQGHCYPGFLGEETAQASPIAWFRHLSWSLPAIRGEVLT